MRFTRFNCLPLIFFGVVYLLTCYIGTALLVWGPSLGQWIYRFYSGVTIAPLPRDEMFRLVMLLNFAPVLLGLGYGGGLKIASRYIPDGAGPLGEVNGAVVRVLWLTSALTAAISAWRGGSFGNVTAWVASYDTWVAARWQLFALLSVPEFINLYVFLPVLTSLHLLTFWRTNPRQQVLIFFVGLVLTLFLFQRKQPIVYLMVVLMPFALPRIRQASGKRWISTSGLSMLGAVFAAYLALFFVPVLGFSDNVEVITLERGNSNKVERDDTTDPQLAIAANEDDGRTRKYLSLPPFVQDSLFAVNSIIFRTSAPAVFYPSLFPRTIPFYGLDLPFDGFTPDDNRAVWKAMWPDTPGGSVTVPFQFALYAQVGLTGALLLSAVIGLTLGLVWGGFVRMREIHPVPLVLGTLALVFSVFIAIDSVRNSVIASYGLAWGVLLVGLIVALSRALSYRQRTRV